MKRFKYWLFETKTRLTDTPIATFEIIISTIIWLFVVLSNSRISSFITIIWIIFIFGIRRKIMSRPDYKPYTKYKDAFPKNSSK